MSPRQINAEYYNQVLRSCLGKSLIFEKFSKTFFLFRKGFGVYYVNEENSVNLINFNLISSDLSQDASAVIRGIRILRKQAFFTAIEKPNYVIWLDTGKCFRNSQILGYFLIELARENIHGKKL